MFRFLALGLIGLAGPAAAQTSNAAAYLLDEQLTAACGTDASAFMDPAGLIERDFDGDGRLDLLISHEGITCPNAEFNTRSGYCGVQVCSVLLYLRRGDLLVLEEEFLGGGIEVSAATPPVISGFSHGGATWAYQWDGTGFR